MEAAKNGGGLLGNFSVFIGITNKEYSEKSSDKWLETLLASQVIFVAALEIYYLAIFNFDHSGS